MSEPPLTLMPPFLRATGLEYRFRFLLHGLIYVLGFAAPWHLPLWGFLQSQSSWFLIADAASKPTFTRFPAIWDVVCAGMLLCAAAGAALRVWGAAYLGAATVHQGGMDGRQVIASGPYRFVRNPLYLGTLLHTVALALMMRPEAAVLTLVLITVLQFRLIGREEPYLLANQGSAYASYAERVPRLLPALRPVVTGSGATPDWRQGLLSEVYMVGTALSLAVAGWLWQTDWNLSILHVLQGLIVALGLSVVAMAFMPQAADTNANKPAEPAARNAAGQV